MYDIKYRNENDLKDSGVEWVGSIPCEWYIKNLRYLSTIDTGNKDTQDKVADGEYPFYVRSDTVERINSFSFNGEAILTAGDGVGVGRVFHYVNGKFAYHQRVYKLADFRYVIGKYLYYYISENFHKEVMKLSAKSTVDSLRRPMFSNFPVVFPITTEQQKIVNFLDIKTAQFDNIIAKKEQLIKKLEEAKKSLISEVVTGKVKIVDGKLVPRDASEMKDSGVEWLGMIPMDWDTIKLLFLSKRIIVGIAEAATQAYRNEGTPIVRATNVKNGNVRLDDLLYLDDKFANKIGSKKLKDEDILTVRTGNAGQSAIVPKELDGAHCFTMLITTLMDNVDSAYVHYFLNSYNGVEYFNITAWGTAQKNISVPILGNVILPKISIDEQMLISKYLNEKATEFDEIIALTKSQIQTIKLAKQSLISEAVTGKINLRDWEIIEEGELQ